MHPQRRSSPRMYQVSYVSDRIVSVIRLVQCNLIIDHNLYTSLGVKFGFSSFPHGILYNFVFVLFPTNIPIHRISKDSDSITKMQYFRRILSMPTKYLKIMPQFIYSVTTYLSFISTTLQHRLLNSRVSHSLFKITRLCNIMIKVCFITFRCCLNQAAV